MRDDGRPMIDARTLDGSRPSSKLAVEDAGVRRRSDGSRRGQFDRARDESVDRASSRPDASAVAASRWRRRRQRSRRSLVGGRRRRSSSTDRRSRSSPRRSGLDRGLRTLDAHPPGVGARRRYCVDAGRRPTTSDSRTRLEVAGRLTRRLAGVSPRQSIAIRPSGPSGKPGFQQTSHGVAVGVGEVAAVAEREVRAGLQERAAGRDGLVDRRVDDLAASRR